MRLAMALVNTDTKIIDTDSHLTEDGPRLVDGVGRWQMDGLILNSTTVGWLARTICLTTRVPGPSAAD
jgi:hypothetical protein